MTKHGSGEEQAAAVWFPATSPPRCRGLSGPGSQSHRITIVIVVLVIFLVMPVIFAGSV